MPDKTSKHLLIFFTFFSLCVSAQELDKTRDYYLSAIGFWNVENLYDTLNDPWKNDEEFTLTGAYRWDGKRYRTKIDHLATVIAQMATDITPDGLSLLGVCEIENKNVLIDLIHAPQLKKRNYQFIHMEGPDSRGVDPALIYNPAYFQLKNAIAYPVRLVTDSSHKTRDILLVSGYLAGEALVVLVNHWPSRRGGELLSRANRNAAAKLVRHIADSVAQADTSARIVIMGDLNDDPTNESVKKHIGTYAYLSKARADLYFNPMERLYIKGIGTLAWQDSWNLFDQVLLNKNWIKENNKGWFYYKVRVFNKDYLRTGEGNFKGYPFRTYSSGTYTGGYSDHFPVYIVVAKLKQ